MKNKTILIVDDSEFDRDLLIKALTRKGKFDFIEANTGDECQELLLTQKVDLILMDIMMPGTFGTQVLVKIREKFNPIDLPIIMVTAKDDTSDVVGCLQTGANDYITKPVNFDIAVSRISTHLKLADLSHEMSKLQEISALDAMITTYNHEINNPLSVALGNLQKATRDRTDDVAFKRTETALWKVADIVKKIHEVVEKKEIEYEQYVGSTKMVKLRK